MVSCALGFAPQISVVPLLNLHHIWASCASQHSLPESGLRVPSPLFCARPAFQRKLMFSNTMQLDSACDSNTCTGKNTEGNPSFVRTRLSRRTLGALSLPLITGFSQAQGVDAAVDPEKESRLMKRSGSGAPDSNEFYQKWRYAQASDILPYIFATAREGQVDEILDAMDEFGLRYPMYKLGHEKGLILEEELSKLNPKPKVALELGTFLGYSAMRTARILGEGGKLTCIEYNPEHSEVAMTLIKYAGLGDRVKIITGSSTDVLPDLWDFGKADFILLDHKKSLYLPDTLTMEKLGIIQAGTVLAADNVIYPGAPDFLNHVQKGPMYATRIREAAFEYDLKWKQDWESKADGISFSVRQ